MNAEGRPRFRVLDEVEMIDRPDLDRALIGQRGVVTQVRRLSSGGYQYVLGTVKGASVGTGLVDEAYLRATGTRATLDSFRLPGRFRVREIVLVATTSEQREIAGKEAVVSGAYLGEGAELELSVWVDDLQTMYVVSERDLIPTRRRLSPTIGTHPGRSTAVGEDGVAVGSSLYEVVDDIDRYL